MSIVNELLEAYIKNVFSQKHLNLLKEINPVELASIFDIEDLEARNYLIKSYLTTYDDKILDSAQKINENSISEVVRVWGEEMINEEPESLISGMIGYSFLTTNLVSKIRDNIKNEIVSDFESQVYSVFSFLKNKIEEDYFLFTLFGSNKKIFPKEKDNIILEKSDEECEIIYSDLIKKVLYICDIWEYYISKSKGEDNSSLIKKIKSQNKNIFAKTILPPSVYKKMEFILLEKNEESDFIDILNISDSPQKAVFEDTKGEKESISNEGKKIMDTFKGIRDSNKSINKKYDNNINKKRNVLKSAKTNDSGNGKKIVVTVLLMLSISAFAGILIHKSSETKEEPISKAILSGINANVTINEVEIEPEEKKEDN